MPAGGRPSAQRASPPQTPPPPDGLLEIAVIAKAHGLTGEVSVRPVSNNADRFEPSARFDTPAGELTLTAARPHGDRWLMRFAEVAGREAAVALAGCPLWAAPVDDPAELWVHELIGSVVVDQHGVDRGRVAAVRDNPASDLLELDAGHLVPLAFVTGSGAGRIDVDVPDGLFDLNG